MRTTTSTLRAVRAARHDLTALAVGLRRAPMLRRARQPGRVAADVRRVRALMRALRPPAGSGDLVLAVVLRRLGHDARLVVGYEDAPPGRPARTLHWVEVDGAVVSTDDPVREVFRDVAAVPGPTR